jgi:alkylation response protein AidB-like acyl-CoA dehydrogenase
LKYSQERKALEKKFKHQAISFKLADMATQIMAAKMLCLKAACEKDQLILLSQVLWQNYLLLKQLWITIEAVQIHGGNGYVAEYHVERMMRDAKITTKYMRERQKYNAL